MKTATARGKIDGASEGEERHPISAQTTEADDFFWYGLCPSVCLCMHIHSFIHIYIHDPVSVYDLLTYRELLCLI